jgi:hypothetical protein
MLFGSPFLLGMFGRGVSLLLCQLPGMSQLHMALL